MAKVTTRWHEQNLDSYLELLRILSTNEAHTDQPFERFATSLVGGNTLRISIAKIFDVGAGNDCAE